MKMPTAVVRRRVFPWKPGDPITFPPAEDSLLASEAGQRLPVVASHANGNNNAIASSNATTTTTAVATTTGVTANGLFHVQQAVALPGPPSSSRKSKDKSSPPPLVVMTSSAPPSGQGDRKRFPILGPTRQDTELYFRRRRSARNRIRAQSRPAVTRSRDRVIPADCSPVRLTYSTDLSSNASSNTIITPSASATSLPTTTATNGINNDALRNFYLAGGDISSSSSSTATKQNTNERGCEALPPPGTLDTSPGSTSTSATAASTTATPAWVTKVESSTSTTATTAGVLPNFEKRGIRSAGTGLKVAATSADSRSSSLPLVELPTSGNNNNNRVEISATTTNTTTTTSTSTACYHVAHFQRGEHSPAVLARTSLPCFDRSYTYHAGSGGAASGGGGSAGEGGGSGSGGEQYSMVRSGGGGGSGGIRKLEIPIKFLSESGQVLPSELTHRILHKQQQQQHQQQQGSGSKQSEKTLQPSKHGFHRRSKSPTFKRLVEAVEKLQTVSADSDSDSHNTDTCTGRGSPTTVRLPAVPGIVVGGGGGGDGGGEGEEMAYLHQNDFLSSLAHSTYRSQHHHHQYHHHHPRGVGGVKRTVHGRHHLSNRHVHHQMLNSSTKRHSFHATPAHGPRRSERGAPPSNSCSTSPPALGDLPVYLLGPGDRFYDDDDDDEEGDDRRREGRGRRLGRGGGGGGDALSTTTTHPDLTNGWGAWEVDSSVSVDSCLDPSKINLPVGMAPADAHTELHLFLPRLADTPSEDGTANGTGAATATATAASGAATARSASKPSAQVSNLASAPGHQPRSRTAALENRASTSSVLGLAHRGKAVPTVHPHTSHRPPQHPFAGVHAQTQTPMHGHGQNSHSAGSSGGERHGRSQTAKRFTSPVRGPSKRDRTPSKRRVPLPPSDVYEMYEPFIKGEHLKEKMEDFPTLISLDQD